MRTGRILAVLAIPIVAIACATGSAPVILSGEGGSGGGGDSDASYGADDAGQGSDGGGGGIDSGSVHGIDSGIVDSGGGGGGGALVTPGGDCIGDPAAPAGYDFECEFDEAFGDDEPCTPDAGMCATNYCCFGMTSSMCYSDYGPQCVQYQ